MAGIKIHQYPLERFTFGDDDYYDIDYWDGAGYQTAKIKGSVLKAALAANLFTDDLTLSASRNQNLNSQQFKMRNGSLQFGEVGAGLISSFLVESSNFDVRTADPLGDHTSLNIGGSGGTIQNISASGSNIGKIQITGPTLSGVFTSGGVGPVVSANPSLYSVVNEDPGTGDKTTILQTHTDITQLSEDATRSTRIYQTKDILQIANFLASGGGDQITLRWDNTLNNLVIEDDRLTKTGIEYYADYSGSFTARSLVDKGYVDANAGASELNDLTDVNTGLPVSPTAADDGKLLFYDHAVNEFITDDAVTHGTVIINGKKSTAGTIAKGTPVYLVGFDADLHTVEVADATSSATMPIIGLAAESMDDTNSKHITTFGKLTGVDTTATSALNPNGETWAVNDALYMSTTAGGFTKVRPTGGATQIQRIAKVLKVDATGGQLFVFNTARTAGLPNLGTDKLWIGDANGIPQEVDKSTIGASIYTQDDTIGSGRVATITDFLRFAGGRLDLSTTTDGFLMPRLTTAQMNAIASPTTNLLIYNTDLNSMMRYNGSAWVSMASGYGLFSVNDSNGEPTYYATLYDAYNNAVSGQKVMAHTDYEETSDVVIAMKSGVDIDLNGYTYTKNNASANQCFSRSAGSYKSKINNGRIIRKNGLSTGFAISSSTGLEFDLSNLYVENENGGVVYTKAPIKGINSSFISNSSAIGFWMDLNVDIEGGYIENKGTGTNKVQGTARNVRLKANGSNNVISAINCEGESNTGSGLLTTGGNVLINCVGYSNSSNGIGAGTGSITYNCRGYSNSGIGFGTDNSELSINCYGESVSNYGVYCGKKMINCIAISGSSSAVFVGDVGNEFIGGYAEVKTGTSNAIIGSNDSVVNGTKIKVADPSAVGVQGTASGMYIIDVDVRGTATAFSGTNLRTAVKDLQGNSAQV